LFAGEGDAILKDPDDGGDHADLEAFALERLSLFNMGLEITDVPAALGRLPLNPGKACGAERLAHGAATGAVDRRVDIGFGDAADIGAAAEEMGENAFLVATSRHLHRTQAGA